MAKRRWWRKASQHKQIANHVTIRVDSLQLIIRETYNMGVEDERKRVSQLTTATTNK